MRSDPRIGNSHTSVPGFDGKMGFGGACFPKDTSAFLDYAISFSLLDEVIKSNNKIRSKYTKDKRELKQNISFNK
jgi:UDP-glucose 6-dehydrogenase